MVSTFRRKGNDLVAGNRRARLTLAVVSGGLGEEEGCLSEAADLNVSVALRGRRVGGLRLLADGEPVACAREGNRLWGRFSSGPRVGEVRFEVVADGRVALTAEVEVRPAKLDYRTHFEAMRADIEATCRSLLFRMPGGVRARRSAVCADGPSAAEYLGLLEGLFADLAQAVEAILRSPCRRLTRRPEVVEVSRARGGGADGVAWVVRTPSVWVPVPSGGTAVRPLRSSRGEVYYRAVQEAVPRVDVDLPENRLLRHVLVTLRGRLKGLVERGTSSGNTPPSRWVEACRRMLSRVEAWLRSPLFQSLSSSFPSDMTGTLLDARYLQVLRVHRDLSRGLGDLRGRPFEVSFRDTPELYEYWVYLKLVEIFTSLGFTPLETLPSLFVSEDALQVALGRGLDFAVRLASPEGLQATLFYNRTYTTRGRASLTHDMRPDVVCEVETRKGKTAWVFDAKYRRAWDGGRWGPTQEDIDQMHAYRDGIGRVGEGGGFQRLMDGAYVLFPAEWDEAYLGHRFYRSAAYGIGGFPLMPGDGRTVKHLREWIGEKIKAG
ncbi:MAG: hypothetical protein A3F84_14200 [Candidatus Handelsmanbacteria bacterium RIFCSPLOWO2_12_FULL_64_10]|uniref:DUF2357 domain-containing protein n=1 Tax=Handelsmanbacteria sp. (strain RIFCSPLOWO2_12_FULL_64_10) TaxID=1817868 RepID=A0A1F6CUN5_HANXR|nr:MAG: hypothetical protein A3F84_14200 [Candidatus Handelsmanbacteria bacterium RIFCSPLOWO2_12_FULL_64_10]